MTGNKNLRGLTFVQVSAKYQPFVVSFQEEIVEDVGPYQQRTLLECKARGCPEDSRVTRKIFFISLTK